MSRHLPSSDLTCLGHLLQVSPPSHSIFWYCLCHHHIQYMSNDIATLGITWYLTGCRGCCLMKSFWSASHETLSLYGIYIEFYKVDGFKMLFFNHSCNIHVNNDWQAAKEPQSMSLTSTKEFFSLPSPKDVFRSQLWIFPSLVSSARQFSHGDSTTKACWPFPMTRTHN